jgi:alkylation response protein AidB-like acyl-CoA dehydrogenase
MPSVSREARQWISYEAVTAVAGADAPTHDQAGSFPSAAFSGLGRLGLIGNPPLRCEDARLLFRLLAATGRGDLSVGRIFEGHINALFLIHRFGSPDQRERFQTLAAGGALFGIWNTDVPASPVRLDKGSLSGKKNFASGVDGLAFALITAATPQGRQMAVVPVKDLPVDRRWWCPLGMRASGSHIVDFDRVQVPAQDLLGGPDDYLREPWFSAGAIRFAAVHVGGMHAVLDTTLNHLLKCERAGDPHQQHRLGSMGCEVATGYAWLDHAATYWAGIEGYSARSVVAAMSAARAVVERAALRVLELAERSVGATGMIAPHPLERLVRDLRTYLRQPNPDKALSEVAAAMAEGAWGPDATTADPPCHDA